MPESWQSYPAGLALALLFGVAMLRGQATYWLARVVTTQALRRTHPTQGWRARAHAWLSGGATARGRVLVQRYGVVAVPLCYLTVGLQTVVLASAGVLRMPWLRFTLAQVLGALAWATVYSTVGLAVWVAVLTGHPLLVAGMLLAAALGLAALHRRRPRGVAVTVS